MGKLLSVYFESIKTLLSERLNKQLDGVLKTNQGDYEIMRFDQFDLDEFHIENEKIHNLFSPKGFKISGTILLKVSAYAPNSNKNSFTSHYFVIGFKPTLMKFHFNEEMFSVDENIDISYINKSFS